MHAILVRLILLAALMDLGMSLTRIEKCDSRECTAAIERASRQVLQIEWKPISVFPEERLRLLNRGNSKGQDVNNDREPLVRR